ncbi:L,D-transpeptidase family protein [Streptomyces sp. BI20]|uniref:L,D-transpeptidase family protein n=1 Tax=Streptomyces sp. BI20 TaxID=3403460 RepID=UPI003C7829F9
MARTAARPPARTRIRATLLAAVTALAAVPLLTPTAGAAVRPREPLAPEPACTARTGPYQRELEAHLRRPVDGVQSPADCVAIRAFQRERHLTPADGHAGVATYRSLVALRAAANPNAAGRCPVRSHRVTCVDLDRQLLWVQKGRKILYAPVPVRTGRDDEETRPGTHEIYWRNKDHHSTLYDSPMPYAQFFDGGQALHGRHGDLYGHGGSAGCVNLTVPDAARLWDLLVEGDVVHIWGTKPGTED